ncbi:MAG: transposase [Gaiellaceae bacterium]
MPRVRDAGSSLTSKLFRRRKRFLATKPLQALVIGAFVRGLSMRDVESLCEEAGLGQVSKLTASRLCRELKERFQAFRARPARHSPGRPLFGRDPRPALGGEGGRALGLGHHRSGRAGAARRLPQCAKPRRTGSASAARSPAAACGRRCSSSPTAPPAW